VLQHVLIPWALPTTATNATSATIKIGKEGSL